MSLTKKHCLAGHENLVRLTSQQTRNLLSEIKGWVNVDEHHLSRCFEFKDFNAALLFVNEVGKIAEEEGHHPDIYLSWGKVKIDIWTHKIDGLTENDFILAAKIDSIR